MRRLRFVFHPMVLGLILLARSAPAAATITVFDVPGAVATNPTGINSAGDVTGNYTDLSGNIQGFLRTSNGTFTEFSVTGATFGTYPTGINSSDEITGYFWVTANTPQGFLRSSNGTITIFNLPSSYYTKPTSINNLWRHRGLFLVPGLPLSDRFHLHQHRNRHHFWTGR